jgi:hypothetical protein
MFGSQTFSLAAGAAGLPRQISGITGQVQVVVLCIAAGERQNEDVEPESGRSKRLVAGEALRRAATSTQLVSRRERYSIAQLVARRVGNGTIWPQAPATIRIAQ